MEISVSFSQRFQLSVKGISVTFTVLLTASFQHFVYNEFLSTITLHPPISFWLLTTVCRKKQPLICCEYGNFHFSYFIHSFVETFHRKLLSKHSRILSQPIKRLIQHAHSRYLTSWLTDSHARKPIWSSGS